MPEGIVVHPEQRLSKMLLLKVAQGQQLGMEWNDTQLEYPQDVCVHQLFEAQVEQTPDAIAVVFENQHLTYWELNARANQLAHYLQALGVKPEVLVALCVERSIEMVVGMLGILKAGGAYVPLDPHLPQERITFMLSDSQASVLLTHKQLLATLPECEAQVVCLEKDSEVISRQSEANIVTQITANNLIYVIYTSGSTGQPKGVMIPHRGICNQLYWRQKTFGLSAQDKVFQTISVSFDPSVWQIFWPLSFGAQLILARPGGHQDTAYLVNTITSQQITVIALVPSILRVLLEDSVLENCHSLRHITCGGEALSVELIERFLSLVKKENVLFNCYGPTEASIDTTFWSCQRGTHQMIAPIGRPIANVEIYILDEDLQLVSVGEPGELHIGGVGLARGYLNRPELNAQKFIRNPFTDFGLPILDFRLGDSGQNPEPGEINAQISHPKSKIQNPKSGRLYKTGDLVRYLPDGNIEFLGRIDDLVKIRGFRIELGEIEAMLSQHPAIKQTLVIAREDVKGDKRLVAYVVANSQSVLNQIELRSFLLNKLPEYMIPSAFVFLDALPLNPNGKIDRYALPAPNSFNLNRSSHFVAPRDELEQKLTQIWQQVLDIQPIGVQDNFFELGGHSLQAAKLFWQIEKAFGKNLPLATLFQSGTVADIAKIIRQEEKLAPVNEVFIEGNDMKDLGIATLLNNKEHSVSWSSLVGIQPHGSKPPFFCIHHMEGNVLAYYNLAHYLDADQPFYGLQAQGLDGKQAPHNRIEDMASHYIKEMQTIQPKGPYFIGGYSFGGLVAFEMAQQLHKQGEKVALLVLFDTPILSADSRLPFLQRVPLHLKNLLQNGPDYIGKKVKQWFLWLQSLLKYQQQKIAYKFYQTVGSPLPCNVRNFHIREAYVQASEKYILQAYPGRVTLFGVEEQMRVEGEGYKLDPNFGWSRLATGGLEIHYVPGTHYSMLTEPHVKVVGEKLQACLKLAQAAVLTNESGVRG